MTNEQCYAWATPLEGSDFRVLARTFAFDNGEKMEQFVTAQQTKVNAG